MNYSHSCQRMGKACIAGPRLVGTCSELVLLEEDKPKGRKSEDED